MSQQSSNGSLPPVAIIGMAARFPGARNPEDFWRNLRDGVESISTFTDTELELANGDAMAAHGPRYVMRRAILDEVEMFDASFFGYTPREAELTDPQQRLFLQCAYEALESAGYDPERFEGSIGVFGGAGFSHYLFANLLSNRELIEAIGLLQISIRNRVDHLTTNVAYRLNLKGPAVTVQTACSTSLAAVHLACQSLIGHECDMALAGGVSIALPQKSGYLYQEGGILSPDGHCRAFDARAQGTVNGNGAGIVVLKRLEDALRDRDHIEAVILGSAMNNDGSLKVGYTAPSVEGQAQVIAEAQMVAGVEADTISYIEAHGTGTSMGDPIEMSALTQAFRQGTTNRGFCAIGSVKTNIGHLDTAAGIAGLIKTVLSLGHRMLPPSLHFEESNPEIDFEGSPFFVNAQLQEWKAQATRRAGVSSFGIGGTNVHAIVEEAPPVESGKETRPWQLLLLSARTATALQSATGNLAKYLERHENINLPDVAYTLQTGRREFNHRHAIVCRDREDAVQALQTLDPARVATTSLETRNRSIVFMFPGQGAQHVNMARGLYESEPVFRNAVDQCANVLRPHLGFDLPDVLYPHHESPETVNALTQTRIAQPALFVIEYALARLWMEWGVEPKAMIGHSLGDYVAATLAGVLFLEDALGLVAARGRLMQGLPAGSMLVIPLPEGEVTPLLGNGLALAAVNGPASCVVSGTAEQVQRMQNDLAARGVACRSLSTSHAFHSPMMDPILEAFAEVCGRVTFHAPQVPFISNLSGTWITDAQATSPEYWVRQLRETVRFGDGISNFVNDTDWMLLEVGPGRTLSSLARQNPRRAAGQTVLSSLRHADDSVADEAFLLGTLGKLWLAGVRVEWNGFYQHEQRKRVSIPVYPFEPRRCWIDAQKDPKPASASMPRKRPKVADWFHVPSWKRVPLAQKEPTNHARPWLVFCDRFGVGTQLAGQLRTHGIEVFTVQEGLHFAREERAFTVRPRFGEDYEALLSGLHAEGKFPERTVHLWNLVDSQRYSDSDEGDFDLSFWSPVFLARAVGTLTDAPQTELLLVSNHLYDVTGDPVLQPQRATLLGPCRVVPQEYPGVACRHIDLDLIPNQSSGVQLSRMVTEFISGAQEKIVAYRKEHRWVQTFEPLHVTPAPEAMVLRQHGTYLITGGLGGIGLVIAEQLAESVQARLVLTGCSDFPARESWKEWLRSHEETDQVSARIRKVQALESLGAEVLVLTADVSNRAQMRNAINQTRERFGEIHGVVHAAGVPGGGVIQLKTLEKATAVMAPKITGTMVLASELRNTPLDFFVACSSRTSILGGFGQVDYCAAGAFLDVFAHWSHRSGGNRVTSVNWDAWQDVGMLAAKASEFGIVAGNTTAKTGHPLLAVATVESQELQVFTTTISPATHWIVDEHRISGYAVMPGVAYLEMARAAARQQSDGVIEIWDALFVAPLYFHNDEPRDVKVILQKKGEGYTFRVLSRPSENASGDEWQEHATATIRLMPQVPVRRHDLSAIEQRCNRRPAAPMDASWIWEGMGPRWQVCTHVSLGEHELLASLELPERFASELEQLQLYPTLLDRAVAATKQFLIEDGIYLPLGYGRVRIHRPLERKVYAHIRLRSGQESRRQTIAFDMVLMNEQGEELIEIEEMSEKRINDPAASAKAFLARQDHKLADKSPVTSARAKHDGMVASAYAASLQHGILPKEGREAFRYILGLRNLPQVIVSTRDFMVSVVEAQASQPLAALLQQSSPLSEARLTHERPAMQTAYAAATNPLEEKITEVWKRVLGISQVGVHDNYFDLGGDSVQAIQIIAQLNQQGFQLTPQKLFQNQTVAELAAAASQLLASREEPSRIENETSPSPSSGHGPSDFALAGLDETGLRELAGILEEADMESGQSNDAPVAAGRKNRA